MVCSKGTIFVHVKLLSPFEAFEGKNLLKIPVFIPAPVSGILRIQDGWALLDRSSEAPQTLRILHAMTFLHWLHQATLANVSCFYSSALPSSVIHPFLHALSKFILLLATPSNRK